MSFLSRLPNHVPAGMVFLTRFILAGITIRSFWPPSNPTQGILAVVAGAYALSSPWLASRTRGWWDLLPAALCMVFEQADLTAAFTVVAVTESTRQILQASSLSWMALSTHGAGVLLLWQSDHPWTALALLTLAGMNAIVWRAWFRNRETAAAREKRLLSHQDRLRHELDSLTWMVDKERQLNRFIETLLDGLRSGQPWDEQVADLARKLTGARHLGVYGPGNPWTLHLVKSAITGEHPPFAPALSDEEIARLKLGEYLSCRVGDGTQGIYVLAYRKETGQGLRIAGEYTQDDHEILRRFLYIALLARDMARSSC